MTLEEIKHNVDLHTSHLRLKLDEFITKQDMLHAAVEQWSKQGYSQRGRNFMRTSVNFRAFNWNDRPQIQMVGLYDRAHYLVSFSGLVNPQRACASKLC